MRTNPAALHTMACNCRTCRPRQHGALRRSLAHLAHGVRQAWSMPLYDPARREFHILSRETFAVVAIVAPTVVMAIALTLALQP